MSAGGQHERIARRDRLSSILVGHANRGRRAARLALGTRQQRAAEEQGIVAL
jgi:hypothetical protein